MTSRSCSSSVQHWCICEGRSQRHWPSTLTLYSHLVQYSLTIVANELIKCLPTPAIYLQIYLHQRSQPSIIDNQQSSIPTRHRPTTNKSEPSDHRHHKMNERITTQDHQERRWRISNQDPRAQQLAGAAHPDNRHEWYVHGIQVDCDMVL
jgi:hypothetical protein